MKQFLQQRIARILSLGCAVLCPYLTNAGLNFEIDLYTYGDAYIFYTPVRTNSVGANPPTGSYLLTSPKHPTGGNWRRFTIDENGLTGMTGGSFGYNTFAEVMDQITNGTWRIVVTNSLATNTYEFTVSATDFSSDLLQKTHITFPEWGATGVDQRPVFTWTGPTDWGVSAGAMLWNDENFFESKSVPPSETSVQFDVNMPPGNNTFYVRYATNYVQPLFTATTPLHTNTGDPISGWTFSTILESVHSVDFSVSSGGGGSGSGHTLIAWYDFEDGSLFTRDLSGQDHPISAYGGFGTNPQLTSTANSGSYAVEFDGNSYVAPNAALLTTLAESFTVSLWLQTTDSTAYDDDEARFGKGIFSASSFSNDEVLPMTLTGNKLAFGTGDGPNNSLYSLSSINTGQFVHLVVTRDAGTGEKKIYVNGQLEATGVSAQGSLNVSEELTVGFNYYGFAGLTGIVDDIQVYSGVLSEIKVEFLYNNPDSSVPDESGGDFNTALNTTNLNWITYGDAPWSVGTHEGDDGLSARSGALDQYESSTLETTITGPGYLTFRWKNDTEDYYFYTEFLIDGEYQTDIYGTVDWYEEGPFFVPAGTHTLKWTAYMDGDMDFDSAAWLDQVEFAPLNLPQFTRHPLSQTNYPGYDVGLFAEASGTPEPSYQWHKVGVGPIPGATSNFFSPTNSGHSSVAGSYFVVADNGVTSVSSSTAVVSFVSAPLPPDWSFASKLPLDSSLSSFSQTAALALWADTSGNLYSQSSASGTITVGPNTYVSTNGKYSSIIVKQSPEGALIWSRAITNDGSGTSYPQGIAAAPDGGIYVSGVFEHTNSYGATPLVETGGGSVYLLRLDEHGNLVWARTIGGTNFAFQSFNQIVTDDLGNVTVGALISDTTSFGGQTNIVGSGQRGAIAQFDPSGSLRWVVLPSGAAWNIIHHQGVIYFSMSGKSSGTNIIGNVTNISDRAWVLAAVDGLTGEPLWLRGIGGAAGVGHPNGLIDDVPTLAASGTNLFVVGSAWSGSATFGSHTVHFPGSKGQYFARFDTNGTAQAAVGFGGESTFVWSAEANASGDIYVLGDFEGVSNFGGRIITAPPLDRISPGYASHGYLAKFDASGTPLWVRTGTASGAGLVNLRGLAVVNDGVWVDGFFEHPAEFGTNTVYGNVTCIGTPVCQLQHMRSPVIAKVTEAAPPVLEMPLLNSQVADGKFKFSFTSVPGVTHTIQYRTNLLSGEWLTNSTIAGDGSQKNVEISLSTFSGAPGAFVRVKSQ